MSEVNTLSGTDQKKILILLRALPRWQAVKQKEEMSEIKWDFGGKKNKNNLINSQIQ